MILFPFFPVFAGLFPRIIYHVQYNRVSIRLVLHFVVSQPNSNAEQGQKPIGAVEW